MKIKLDENLPARLAPELASLGHDTDTVKLEGLTGRPDQRVWAAAQAAGRLLITQDLDFSDIRRFAPGTHPGLLLVRLHRPGANALLERVAWFARSQRLDDFAGCFIVLTDSKLRVRRP